MSQIPAPERPIVSPNANHPTVLAIMAKAETAWKAGNEILSRFKDGAPLPKDEEVAVRKALDEYKGFKDRADLELVSLDAQTELARPRVDIPLGGKSEGGETKGGAPVDVKTAEKDALEKKAFRDYLRVGPTRMDEKSLSAITDTNGALLIPRVQSTEILNELRNMTFIMARARVFQTDAAGIDIPTTNVVGLAGGQPVPEENGTPPVASYVNVIGQNRLTPKPRQVEIQIPRDLIEDSAFDVEGYIREECAMDLGEKLETDFFNGTGVGRPKGVFATTLPNAFTSGAAGNAFKPEDIQKTPFRTRAVFRKMDAVWTMPRALVESVMLMRTDSGAGAGTGPFLWQPSFQAGQPVLLAGYPLEESEFFPTPSGSGDPLALFGSWRAGYWIHMKRSTRFERLVELEARKRLIVILAEVQVDGQPVRTQGFVRINRA